MLQVEITITGKLSNYDWLHLHHEDFTGQYSKFYAGFGGQPWYIKQKSDLEALAISLGFKKVSDCKRCGADAQIEKLDDSLELLTDLLRRTTASGSFPAMNSFPQGTLAP